MGAGVRDIWSESSDARVFFLACVRAGDVWCAAGTDFNSLPSSPHVVLSFVPGRRLLAVSLRLSPGGEKVRAQRAAGLGGTLMPNQRNR